jgi:hypothetical protein
MFATRFFCNVYFAPRYWAKYGDTPAGGTLRGLLLLGAG